MKKEVIHEKFGKIEFEENAWTGQQTITINGKSCIKVNKKEYHCIIDGEKKTVKVKGNYLRGATITIDNIEIEIFEKSKWHEWLFFLLPIIFVIVWGGNPILVNIFPIVGGAIGGFISACCSLVAIINVKRTKNLLFKILIGLAGFVATIVICYLVALLILSSASNI